MMQPTTQAPMEMEIQIKKDSIIMSEETPTGVQIGVSALELVKQVKAHKSRAEGQHNSKWLT